MGNEQNAKKIAKATSWSFLSQITGKLIPPLTTMVLARMLAPEVFGIIASITMVISFAETFGEAGFQKYLISTDYDNDEDIKRDADVSFWTHMAISLVLWALIAIFRQPICNIIGSPDMSVALVVACSQLPLTALSGIQSAFLQRKYDFKRLCLIQAVTSIANFIISISLALAGFSYWSIIIGNICGCVLRSILISIKGEWFPHLYFSFNRLKKIFSLSMWIMSEALAVWLTSWFDSFIIGNRLSEYHLGIYKNSQSTVNGLLAIPQNAITSVLIVSLSKAKHDESLFQKTFLTTQRYLAFLLLPMSVGIVLYRDLAVKVVFGDGWEDAAIIIALWTLASMMRILFASIDAAVYIAKGKMKWSLICQIIDAVILIPTCIIGVKYGFETFVIIRCIIRMDIIIPSIIILCRVFKFKFRDMLSNMVKPFICVAIMTCASLLMTFLIGSSPIKDIISILICVIVYLAAFLLFARNDFKNILSMIRKK